MLSQLYEDKLFQTKIHFKLILDEGFRIIKENRDYKLNVYHSIFRRYIYCLDTINLLISDFSSENKYREQPIAIILRASLLDYLTTLYLRTFHAEKKAGIINQKSSYDKEYDKLLSEQLRRILTVSNKDKTPPAYNHESFCNTVDNMYNNFKFLFDESKPLDYEKPANSLKYKRQDDISISTIRERLDMFSKNLKGIDYLHVFSLYDIYSKYDHFGIMSILLENIDINEFCENMLWSVFHITDGISFCVDLLKDEAGCKSDFDKMLKEIDYLRGVIYTKTYWLSPEYKEKNRRI